MNIINELNDIFTYFSKVYTNITNNSNLENKLCPICNRTMPKYNEPDSGYCDNLCRIKAKTFNKNINLNTLKTFKSDINKYKNNINDLSILNKRINNLKFELPKNISSDVINKLEYNINNINSDLNKLVTNGEHIIDLTYKNAANVDNYSSNLRNKNKTILNESKEKLLTMKISLIIRDIKFNIEKLSRKQLNDMLNLKISLLKYSNLVLESNSLDIQLDNVDKSINNISKNIENKKQEFNKAYNKAYGAIISFIPASLNSESINFFITPKSMIWKPTNKMTNELKNINLSVTGSSLSFIDWESTDKLINKYLNEITNDDLSIDIDEFKSKYKNKISTQKNINKVKNIIKNTIMLTSQPIPKYENLKISNPRYSLWAYSCWGSMGKLHFGMLI